MSTQARRGAQHRPLSTRRRRLPAAVHMHAACVVPRAPPSSFPAGYTLISGYLVSWRAGQCMQRSGLGGTAAAAICSCTPSTCMHVMHPPRPPLPAGLLHASRLRHAVGGQRAGQERQEHHPAQPAGRWVHASLAGVGGCGRTLLLLQGVRTCRWSPTHAPLPPAPSTVCSHSNCSLLRLHRLVCHRLRLCVWRRPAAGGRARHGGGQPVYRPRQLLPDGAVPHQLRLLVFPGGWVGGREALGELDVLRVWCAAHAAGAAGCCCGGCGGGSRFFQMGAEARVAAAAAAAAASVLQLTLCMQLLPCPGCGRAEGRDAGVGAAAARPPSPPSLLAHAASTHAPAVHLCRHQRHHCVGRGGRALQVRVLRRWVAAGVLALLANSTGRSAAVRAEPPRARRRGLAGPVAGAGHARLLQLRCPPNAAS